MRRETPSMALLLVGAWIIRLSVSDDYKLYVKDSFGPWLTAAGVLLVGTALTGLVMTLRGGSVDHADHSASTDIDDDEGHEHRSYVGWLLLAPLFAFVLIAPRPLGAYSAQRAAGPPPPVASTNYDPLPAGDPVPLTMREYTGRALGGSADTLQGRTVKLLGFVTPGPGDGFYVTRLAIACCAADALPIKVLVETETPAPTEGSWVAVTGTNSKIVEDETGSYEIATIEAQSVEAAAAPESPYEQ